MPADFLVNAFYSFGGLVGAFFMLFLAMSMWTAILRTNPGGLALLSLFSGLILLGVALLLHSAMLAYLGIGRPADPAAPFWEVWPDRTRSQFAFNAVMIGIPTIVVGVPVAALLLELGLRHQRHFAIVLLLCWILLVGITWLNNASEWQQGFRLDDLLQTMVINLVYVAVGPGALFLGVWLALPRWHHSLSRGAGEGDRR